MVAINRNSWHAIGRNWWSSSSECAYDFNPAAGPFDGDTVTGKTSPDRFAPLLTAAGSIPDPDARRKVMGQIAQAVQAMGDKFKPGELAPIANATIRAMDRTSLGQLSKTPSLAGMAAKGNIQDLTATVNTLSSQPRSPDRNAALRLLFLKTDATAYWNHPGLASTMGHALGLAQGTDPAAADRLRDHYTSMLGTPEVIDSKPVVGTADATQNHVQQVIPTP